MSKQSSSVDRVYEVLREMAIDFEFKPGERLNESALTRHLDVSRTPLREALNRLVAEGFLTLDAGKGFFCRTLSPEKALELYQLRCALESEAVLRGIEQASDEAVDELVAYLDGVEQFYQSCHDLPESLRLDEEFHMMLTALSGNSELLRMLKNTNERIRYVRLVNLRQLRERNRTTSSGVVALSAHREIVNNVQARDPVAAVESLRRHIERRAEQATEIVRLAYSSLYVPEP